MRISLRYAWSFRVFRVGLWTTYENEFDFIRVLQSTIVTASIIICSKDRMTFKHRT